MMALSKDDNNSLSKEIAHIQVGFFNPHDEINRNNVGNQIAHTIFSSGPIAK
jgi:hypothetical protein